MIDRHILLVTNNCANRLDRFSENEFYEMYIQCHTLAKAKGELKPGFLLLAYRLAMICISFSTFAGITPSPSQPFTFPNTSFLGHLS